MTTPQEREARLDGRYVALGRVRVWLDGQGGFAANDVRDVLDLLDETRAELERVEAQGRTLAEIAMQTEQRRDTARAESEALRKLNHEFSQNYRAAVAREKDGWTEAHELEKERDAARERIAELEEALLGVVRVADRDTTEFAAARAALSAVDTPPATVNEPRVSVTPRVVPLEPGGEG